MRPPAVALHALLALAPAGDAPAPAQAAAPAKPRNLLIVTFDTTRRDCMGFLGKTPSVTPNLDRLAAQSCVFTDAYTVAPITLPAHSSLMTGVYPITHGVHDNTANKLPQDALTLAEILKQHGYATAATVGSFVLDPMFGIDQGFDHYDSPTKRGAHVGISVAERRADEQADLALAEIAELQKKPAPFFYWIHFFDPHFPYDAPEKLDATPADVASQDAMARHAYLEELHFADKHLGRVVAQLESSGLAKDLVVVFAADHGESLGDTPEPAHGYFLFDATVRIPLLIRDPACAPRRVDAQATLVDVAPTVLDLLAVPDRETLRFDGADLAPIVRGTTSEPPERALLLESRMVWLNFGWAPFDGCVQERMKYVHSARDELFDRRADPAESRNLFDPEERRSKSLLRRVQEMLATPFKLARDALQMDAEQQRRMKSLVYVIADPNEIGADVPWDRSKLPDGYAKAKLFAVMDEETGAESAGDLPRAIELVKKLVESEPGSARFHEQLGTMLHDLGPGHLDEAERHLKEAVRIDPRRGHAWYLLALCMTERWDQTIADLAAARAGNDEAARERVKALVQKEREQAEQAVAWFDFSLDLEPHALDCLRDEADFLSKLAVRHERGKRIGTARDEYRAVVKLLDQLLSLLPADEKTRPDVVEWRARAQASGERLEKEGQ